MTIDNWLTLSIFIVSHVLHGGLWFIVLRWVVLRYTELERQNDKNWDEARKERDHMETQLRNLKWKCAKEAHQ